MKDVPSIAPVAYASRGGVAPLPDDRAPVEDAAESERRMIEAENEMRLRMAKAVEEERMKVPFPLLIKPKKNEKPPPLDLNEAIRQVKVQKKKKNNFHTVECLSLCSFLVSMNSVVVVGFC